MSINNLEKVDRNNSSFRDLITQFKEVKVHALSGDLIVLVESEFSRMFSFNAGKLVGISGGIDSIDCWHRNLKIAKFTLTPDLSIDNDGN